jgi:thiol-disulfide isomerase/thioredoxin
MKVLVLLSLLLSISAPAQTRSPSATCAPTPEVEQALKRLNIGSGLPVENSLEARQRILAELLQQYPDDLFVHLESRTTFFSTARELQILDQYRALAGKHPDSLMYKFLYARALVDTDTPKAIELLKQVEVADPNFAWTYLDFAEIYLRGRFSDSRQVRNELDKFFELCPNTWDWSAWRLLVENASTEMATRYGGSLRARLITETDREHLRYWKTVWNLEFKAAPVPEHPEVRKRIAADMVRLEHIPGEPDAKWLSFLKTGYKLADEPEAAKRTEQELLTKYPDGQEAKYILAERWWKEHPFPAPDDPESKKQAYYHLSLQHTDELLKASPGDSYLMLERFTSLSEIDGTTAGQLTAAADSLLNALTKDPIWQSYPPVNFQIAKAFVKRNVHPERVSGLVEEGLRLQREREWVADWETDEDKAQEERGRLQLKTQAAELLTGAAKDLKNPEVARASVMELEKLKPTKPEDQSAIWSVKAAFAEVEGRKLDALLMYQAAIKTRPPDPNSKKKDELADNEARLWKELGGSPATRDLWDKKVTITELSFEGGWEKPAKDMPGWELSDLQGRTWKMASLNGKTVLINVWATWCGPCQMELPHFQKVYDKVKDKPDIAVLSFNVDEEVGKVEPFIKEQKYTFPVLLAHDYVNDLLAGISIPRIWVVDTKGKWLWEKIGFDPAGGGWRDDVLAKIGELKAGE